MKVDLTPNYYVFHVYDTKEIAEAKGLDRDYKLFGMFMIYVLADKYDMNCRIKEPFKGL